MASLSLPASILFLSHKASKNQGWSQSYSCIYVCTYELHMLRPIKYNTFELSQKVEPGLVDRYLIGCLLCSPSQAIAAVYIPSWLRRYTHTITTSGYLAVMLRVRSTTEIYI